MCHFVANWHYIPGGCQYCRYLPPCNHDRVLSRPNSIVEYGHGQYGGNRLYTIFIIIEAQYNHWFHGSRYVTRRNVFIVIGRSNPRRNVHCRWYRSMMMMTTMIKIIIMKLPCGNNKHCIFRMVKVVRRIMLRIVLGPPTRPRQRSNYVSMDVVPCINLYVNIFCYHYHWIPQQHWHSHQHLPPPPRLWPTTRAKWWTTTVTTNAHIRNRNYPVR